MNKTIDKNDKKNIMYIHILRIMACFLVIVNHTHGFILNVDHSHATLFYCLGFAFCKMAVPIFICLSAILMLDKDYSYRKIGDMAIKILVPVIALVFLLTIRANGISNFDPISFVKSFLTEPYTYSYWYVYMLLGFYLVLPYIQKMIKNFRDIDYIVFIVAFLLVPSALGFISTYYRFSLSGFWFYAFFPQLLGLIVAGNYISKIKLNKCLFILAVIAFISSYIGMFWSLYAPYLESGKVSYALDTWSALPVVLMACSFTYIVRYLLENRRIKGEKFICTVSKTTFGIYLVHTHINWQISQMGIMQQLLNANCLIGILVIEVVVFVLCAVFVFILEQIPVIKKYI